MRHHDWKAGALPARHAYNLASDSYDQWSWQQFWRHNEAPVVLSLLRDLDRPLKILDVGTGTGYYFDQLSRNGAEVTGLDVSEGMLRQAHKRLGPGARLVEGDVCDLHFPRRSFDAVLAARVFSHIQRLTCPLQQIHRVLRAFGTLIVTDIDPAHDYDVTKVPTPFGKVRVETAKHSFERLTIEAEAVGFGLERRLVLHAGNVAWLPVVAQFSSINRNCDRPIGYIAKFIRCAEKSGS
jgi:ubiquinone/menaquinone biosynthesis C-methylase UbiE